MHDTLVLIAAVAVCLLPGTGLLLALRLRRLTWILGAGPAISVGVATLLASGCALVGLPFDLATFGTLTAILLALGGLWWVRDLRAGTLPSFALPSFASRGQRWMMVARVAGVLLIGVGIALGVRAWLSGLGSLAMPPQEHDTIVHSELTAFIQRTGRGAAWQLMPLDLLTGQPVSFYPGGLHLLSAVTGGIAGSPVEGLNAVTVVLLGGWLPISVAMLTFVAARRLRQGAHGALLAAGVASIVAAGLYRPAIALATEGGVLPNAAMMVLAPGTLAVLLTIRRRDWIGAVAAGFAAAGLLTLHPSAVATVVVTLVAWWIGDALTKGGPRRIGGQLLPLVLAAIVAGVVAAPTLLASAAVGGRIASTPPDFGQLPFGSALGNTLALNYGGGIGQYSGYAQFYAAALALLGVVALLMSRRGYGVLIAWTVWLVIIVAAWLSPGRGFENAITGFFYNAMARIWSNLYLLVPVLAGVGVLLTAGAIAGWVRRRTPVRAPAGLVGAALVLLLAVAYTAVPAHHYLQVSARYLASRYGAPTIDRVTGDDQAAFDYLAGRVRPGERVMNSANDGSTYLYVEKGIPVVNDTTLGVAGYPTTYDLMMRFRDYPSDTAIRNLLLGLNVGWVYVDDAPPMIGAAGLPAELAPGGFFTSAPGLRHLTGLPGLTEAFRHGSVHVYRLDLDTLRRMRA